MSIEECSNYCLSALGYSLFGVEYGGERYCGDELQSGSVLVDDEDCNMACPGNAAEMCGAGNRLSVYQKT